METVLLLIAGLIAITYVGRKVFVTYKGITRRLHDVEAELTWVSAHLKYHDRVTLELQKQTKRIAGPGDIKQGATLWLEHEETLVAFRIANGIGENEFEVLATGPCKPLRKHIYKGPWYIEKESHGKEDR